MAKYFNNFPKIAYSFDDYKISAKIVTNILKRFSFEETLKENSSAFFYYNIKDGDTPEGIAHKYYGSADRHWIVLLFNDIIEPQYQWPLQYDSFNRYVDAKYLSSANSSISGDGIYWSKSNIHSYYRIEITKLVSTGNTIIDTQSFEIDQNTYDDLNEADQEIPTYVNQLVTLADGTEIVLHTDKGTKTYYEYENEVNESKRKLKLLKKEFVSKLELEFNRIFVDA